MSINRVLISGNLTRDPDLRQTQGGVQVLGFGVAVNDRRLNKKTNEWEDVPNFVDVTVFGNRADALSRILHKGGKVAVEGKLRYSSWTDKETGRNRSKLEVVADDVELMQRADGQTSPSKQGQKPVAAVPGRQGKQRASTAPETDIYDEDIPF